MEPGTIPPDKDHFSIIQQQPISYTGQPFIPNINQQLFEKLSRPMVFDKMEYFVRQMQDSEYGVPVRSQKLIFTSVPSAFMGYDLIEWLTERLDIEESEALNLAHQLCLHGYFFPINDKSLIVKDDSSLYRFQSPFYWPWQHKAPDNVDYAIYLVKRSLRNKQRHGLEEHETETLTNLHKNLKGKWDFITMQAEEQVKMAKDRKKNEKNVADSQERAYWRVHRPPPIQFTPLEPCPVPLRDRQNKSKKRTVEDWQRECDYLKSSMGRTRMKMSQACDCLLQYWETFSDYDFFLQPPLPSNPWVTEDTTFWQLNNSVVDIPTEKRVKRWAISIEELVSDVTGLQEFTSYLKKEYSHENIRFWIAVNDLRRSAHSQITRKVRDIYEEFLEPGAPCEINIDGKTMEKVQSGLKCPSRFTFDAAAEHIYALLLKKDCYPRFIRSEQYKSLLATGIQPSHKKRFFGFGSAVGKKKISTTAAPNVTLLSQVPGSNIMPTSTVVNLSRRRGSDRSLTGSAHELAVAGIKDGNKNVPHSHSQSNLSDIPYSVMIYRGDMPSGSLPVTIMETPASTTTGVEDALLKYQDGIKTISENLEPTVEISTSTNICPWDTITEQQPTLLSVTTAHQPSSFGAIVSVSVCPWDDNNNSSVTETSEGTGNQDVENVVAASVVGDVDISNYSISTSTTVTTTTTTKTTTTTIFGKNSFKKNSANDSCSSHNINEVSERMRRSCGLRQQNTLDCDLFSSKRLAPSSNEQRRASMTIAPRLSDLQFSLNQQCCPVDPKSILTITTTTSPTSEASLSTITNVLSTSLSTGTTSPSSQLLQLQQSTGAIISSTEISTLPLTTTIASTGSTFSNDDVLQTSFTALTTTASTVASTSIPSTSAQDPTHLSNKICFDDSENSLHLAKHLIIPNESSTSTISAISSEIIECEKVDKNTNENNKQQTFYSSYLNDPNNNNNNNNNNIKNKTNNNQPNNNNNNDFVFPIENINLNIQTISDSTLLTTLTTTTITTTTTSIHPITDQSFDSVITPTTATTLPVTTEPIHLQDLKNVETDIIDNNNIISLPSQSNNSLNSNTISPNINAPYPFGNNNHNVQKNSDNNAMEAKEIEPDKIESEIDGKHTDEELIDLEDKNLRSYNKEIKKLLKCSIHSSCGSSNSSSSSSSSSSNSSDNIVATCNLNNIINTTTTNTTTAITNYNVTTSSIITTFDALTSIPATSSQHHIAEENILPEELSPTTEEYQECCPNNDEDEYRYDISAHAEFVVASGYVAPAPTPAPLFAPLAEIEMDVQDDDVISDIYHSDYLITAITSTTSSAVQTQSIATAPPTDFTTEEYSSGLTSTLTTPSTTLTSTSVMPSILTVTSSDGNATEQKRKRKRKDTTNVDVKGDTLKIDNVAKTDAEQVVSGNQICPWEDDDISSATDAPFVKTYATLGYL